MKDGFIKVAAGTVDVVVADVQYNTEQILARMREADAAGVNLLTLPELCLTGYTCGDLFFSDCLLGAVEPALAQIVEASKGLYPVTAENSITAQRSSTRDSCSASCRRRICQITVNSMNCGSFPPRKRWKERPIQSLSAARTCRSEQPFCSAAPACRIIPSAWNSARISGFPARLLPGSVQAVRRSF